MIKPEITSADIDRAREKLDSIRNLIVVDSLNFTTAVKIFSDPDAPSYHNNGRMTNPINQSTFFETKDLSPEVYFAIEDLEVGELSEVLEITGPTGETQFQLVKLISKTRPHRANLKEDYSKIQYFAKESKKNEYINNWLETKIRDTYIYVDPNFLKKCPNLNRWTEPNM